MSNTLFSQFSESNTIEKVDGLIVLGYGNSPEGVSQGTIANAEHASRLLKDTRGRFLIATGMGPSARANYPTSEAQAIADVVRASNPDARVYVEDGSISTFDNMGNTPIVLSRAGIETDGAHFGIVAEARHALRAILIARYTMPNTRMTPFAVDHGESRKNDLRERIQYFLTQTAFRGLDAEDPDSFVIARDRYEKYISAPRIIGQLARVHRGRQKV